MSEGRIREEKAVDLRDHTWNNIFEFEEFGAFEAEKFMHELEENDCENLGFVEMRFEIKQNRQQSFPAMILVYERDDK